MEIRDPTCGEVLGSGAAYKPVGVYFKVVDTTDVAIPDVPVSVFAPVGCGADPATPCVLVPGPGTVIPAGLDGAFPDGAGGGH